MTQSIDVSVVVCAYTLDRWELLVRAVESVRAQDGDPTVILVIDHNEELLQRARVQWPDIDVVANTEDRGLSGARNTGVRRATSEVIAFLDDDAVAEPEWLAELVRPFDTSVVGLTSGWVIPEWSDGQPDWFPDEFLWVVGCSYTGLPTAPTIIRNPIGASMAIRRTALLEVGLFHAGVGRVGKNTAGCEETEIAIRARRAGWVTSFAPSSVVRHHVPAERHGFPYFVRRCWSEGQAKAMVATLSGPDDALESERSYVTRTLPRGVWQHIWGRRATRVRGALVIVTGLVVTTAGYGLARLRRLGFRDLATPPTLVPDVAGSISRGSHVDGAAS
jgi:GT2 family glycosyltransferase